MKILLKASLAMILGIFLFSCGQSKSTIQADDTLDRIRQTGVIDACTIIQPPLVIKDSKTGALSGVFVDAMNLIAEKMNAKIHWHETTFGNATAELSSQHCDIAVAALFSTISRAEVVAFTEPPILYNGLSAIIRKNNPLALKAKNILDFDKPGIIVSVATGSAGDTFAQEVFKKATLKKIDAEASDVARNLIEVSANRADIAIFSADVCEPYAKAHPEVTVLFRNPPISINPVSWAVRQTDFKWLHFMETALQFLDTQGTLDQLEKKYHAHYIRLVKQYRLQ